MGTIRQRNPHRGDKRGATIETQRTERRENSAGERQERVKERQGLRCGEANPNQRLRGSSGQRPNADSDDDVYYYICLRLKLEERIVG